MNLKKIVPAHKTENVKYAIRDIIILANEVAKTGKKMFYLNIGDPNIFDHSTPNTVVEATCNAIKSNQNGYAPSSGIKEAIDAIARDAQKKGINNILDIFVTTGASEAIEISLTALLNRGENFLMPTPGYPLYTAVQSKLELEPNPYYLDEANNWQPDIEDIRSKINSKTRAIVLINPNNPTGSVYKKETLEQIVELALEHNLVIIADEIYDKLLFDGKEMTSIAALNQDVSCITFSGLSKNFIAPGFRIGWGVASGRSDIMGDYIEAINKLLRSRVSANHPEQYAIQPALEGDQSHLEVMIKKLETRRNIMMETFAGIEGIDLVKPEGAFYAFPSIDVADDSHFCSELIKETGVIVVPGSGFGQKPGTHHFRIVTLPQEDVLKEAFKHIGDFYKHYKSKN
ncbi:MAG: aminotransferase class I/II-fold pyridoxal phosphate-dependent enzyme [Candidatus Kapabacteria bacterium]|nr:aminotransferase class I/II-fold pyridoxal phosphate-dependent enzyme [Ignavibacteriota bacterium]MCW5885895.1 aminotransferase class I/II-fold pyridoxal phosphate-dependent enzyme [Candidatus Kapabacteria bacterium]